MRLDYSTCASERRRKIHKKKVMSNEIKVGEKEKGLHDDENPGARSHMQRIT